MFSRHPDHRLNDRLAPLVDGSPHRATPLASHALLGWVVQPARTLSPLSKSAVSRLVSRLEDRYDQWRLRDPAEERIVCPDLDAIYPKVRSAGKVVSLPVLVAPGVRETGEKTLLALATSRAETGVAWQMMLQGLAVRHLGRPRLTVSDGNPGLKCAMERIWPGIAHQRCSVHKLRDLLAKAPEHAQEAVHEEYKPDGLRSESRGGGAGERKLPGQVKKALPVGGRQPGGGRRGTADLLRLPGQSA